jgi:hypothetical protein
MRPNWEGATAERFSVPGLSINFSMQQVRTFSMELLTTVTTSREDEEEERRVGEGGCRSS